MNTYYATTEQNENDLTGETIIVQCNCGQSLAVKTTQNTLVIICDTCYENSSNKQKYF